jgi:hypothetical protein
MVDARNVSILSFGITGETGGICGAVPSGGSG